MNIKTVTLRLPGSYISRTRFASLRHIKSCASIIGIQGINYGLEVAVRVSVSIAGDYTNGIFAVGEVPEAGQRLFAQVKLAQNPPEKSLLDIRLGQGHFALVNPVVVHIYDTDYPVPVRVGIKLVWVALP